MRPDSPTRTAGRRLPALANDLPVYTCNADDFSGIADLEVVAVPEPPR